MKKPELTTITDSRGRRLWKKWCATCGAESLVRGEGLYKLCRSCGRAKGGGFPTGTLVDPEFEYLKRFSWSLNNSGYIKGPGGELHRVVMQAKSGQEIHHKNHNKLDCRKDNLEFTTHSINAKAHWALKAPKDRVPKTSTTRISGVSWDKKSGKWRSYTASPAKVLGYSTDFFEACCLRKSWENHA